MSDITALDFNKYGLVIMIVTFFFLISILVITLVLISGDSPFMLALGFIFFIFSFAYLAYLGYIQVPDIFLSE